MEYKGYFAKVEFDDDANIFHGEVINLRDVIKTYSGKFVVRVEPELHKNITVEARKKGKSLNIWVKDAISKALKDSTQQEHSL
jgi:predicted HicB family RNase H-like nuclease